MDVEKVARRLTLILDKHIGPHGFEKVLLDHDLSRMAASSNTPSSERRKRSNT